MWGVSSVSGGHAGGTIGRHPAETIQQGPVSFQSVSFGGRMAPQSTVDYMPGMLPASLAGGHPPVYKPSAAPAVPGPASMSLLNMSAPRPAYMIPQKEHTLRIVEKLGHVAVALGADTSTILPAALHGPLKAGSPFGSSDGKLDDSGHASFDRAEAVHTPAQAFDDWLDDKALNNLSAEELQKIMDRFIGSFMSQLVQFAAVDDELKSELNVLDKRCAYIKKCSCDFIYGLTRISQLQWLLIASLLQHLQFQRPC
jgi:hypothetical protein